MGWRGLSTLLRELLGAPFMASRWAAQIIETQTKPLTRECDLRKTFLDLKGVAWFRV